MLSADWLAEHRSVFTTLSSLLIIAGFLIIAARGGKSRSKHKTGGESASGEIEPLASALSASGPTGPSADVVALLPPSDSETAVDRLGTRPSVFLMPFDVPVDARQQQSLVDEVHDDIVTILSKSSDIAVIGRKAREWNGVAGGSIRSLGRELNARYAVIGDLTVSDGTSRFAVHLLETATGGSIWSKMFPLEDLGEAARAVLVNQVAGSVAAEVLRADAERTLRHEPERLSAESLANRASHSFTAFNRRTFHEIESLARMAIDLKPSYPGAYGVLAGALALRAHQAWTTSPEEDLEQAFSQGGRAIELSPSNPRTLYWWGYVHLYGGRTEDAIGILQRAVAADTSYVPAHIALGTALILTQNPVDGLAKIRYGLNLAPDHAQAFHAHLWLGIGHLELEEGAAAQKAFLASINHNVIKDPTDSAAAFWAWIGTAASYWGAGRRSDAQSILSRLRERFPDHDYGIMFEHAQATFAPHLRRLKVITVIDTLEASVIESAQPANKPSSLRDMFRRRASAGSEMG